MDTPNKSQFNRRKVLKFLAAGAAFCPTCISAAQSLAEAKDHGKPKGRGKGSTHWSYKGGTDGMEHWGELTPGFRVCDLGLQQSPVDLSGSISAGVSPIKVNYHDTALRVVNNGHTIQCNTDAGSDVVIDGKTYKLLQFHFHHPSEHLVDGRPYAMEMHLVHASADGQLAVLGVFLKPGAANQALAPIWSAMPSRHGQEVQRFATRIRLSELLPYNREYFRYHGSLTTPPCSEKVLWTVYRDPIEASRGQIRKLANLFPMNARFAQPMNRRFLLGGN